MSEAHSDAHNDSIRRGHEPDSVSPRVATLSTAGLAMLVASVLLLMHGTILFLSGGGQMSGKQGSAAPTTRTAAGPQLTPDEPQQLRELRQAEYKRLNSYEWVDQSKGIARIPIGRAIDILAEKKLHPGASATEEHNDGKSN